MQNKEDSERNIIVTKVPTLTTIDKNAKREYSIHRFPTIRESSMRFTKVKCNEMVVDSRATSIFPLERGALVNYL